MGRFFRIVPLYVVGLSITLTALWISTSHYGVVWPYSFSEVAVHYVPGLRDLLWSRSIDGIVWTLEIEVKFYVLCALGVVWFRRQSALIYILPAAVFFLSVFVVEGTDELAASAPDIYHLALAFDHSAPYLVFMFIGTTLYLQHVRAITAQAGILAVAALFFGYMCILQSNIFFIQMQSAWSYGAALMLFAFAAANPRLFRSTRVGDFFASISYPLYVVHGVAGYIALRLLLDAGMPAWASLIIVTTGAIGLATALHRLIEMPSDRLGKRLGAKLEAKRIMARVPAA